MKQRFHVTGMSCAACSAKVERTVKQLKGIQKAEVNLLANAMVVEYDETVLSESNIIAAVVRAGYGASGSSGGDAMKQSPGEGRMKAVKEAEKNVRSMRNRLSLIHI